MYNFRPVDRLTDRQNVDINELNSLRENDTYYGSWVFFCIEFTGTINAYDTIYSNLRHTRITVC